MDEFLYCAVVFLNALKRWLRGREEKERVRMAWADLVRSTRYQIRTSRAYFWLEERWWEITDWWNYEKKARRGERDEKKRKP